MLLKSHTIDSCWVWLGSGHLVLSLLVQRRLNLLRLLLSVQFLRCLDWTNSSVVNSLILVHLVNKGHRLVMRWHCFPVVAHLLLTCYISWDLHLLSSGRWLLRELVHRIHSILDLLLLLLHPKPILLAIIQLLLLFSLWLLLLLSNLWLGLSLILLKLLRLLLGFLSLLRDYLALVV